MAGTRPVGRFLLALATCLAATPARADGGLRNGPWLLEPRPGAITVMLERTRPGAVRVTATPIDRAEAATVSAEDPAPVALHAVALTGLAQGVRYRYEASGPGLAPGLGGTFLAAPSRDDAFRFEIYGDTRSDAVVHATTVRAIERDAPAFVLHTGDLVSDGRRDGLWQQFFTLEHELLRNAPLIPVIGNHEIQSGPTGVANFRRYVHVGPMDPSPDPRTDYAVAFGGVRLVLLDAYSDWASAAMRNWLVAQIDGAHRDDPDAFVLVVMHWGPCSSGPHGENRALRAAGIDALMRTHGVDLVISGHDHVYERGDDAGLRYLVTGGGGAELYAHRHDRAYTRAFAREHHFVRADVEPGRIVFTALREDASVIERCPLTHAGWRCDDREVRDAGPVREEARAVEREPARRERSERSGCGCRSGRSERVGWVAVVVGVAVGLGTGRRRKRCEKWCQKR